MKAIIFGLDNVICDTEKSENLALDYLEEELSFLIKTLSEIDRGLDAKKISRRLCKQFYKLDSFFMKFQCDENFTLLPGIKICKEHLLFKELVMICPTVNFKVASRIIEKFEGIKINNLDYYTGVEKMLTTLSKVYKIIIIDRGSNESQKHKVNKLKLDELVDHIMFCSDYGEKAPGAYCFNLALSIIGAGKEKVLYVGLDVTEATCMGISSIWLSNDVHINSISSIGEVVKKISDQDNAHFNN